MKEPRQEGRRRGAKKKRTDGAQRRHTVGVRLMDDEFKRLTARGKLDGRRKAEILRDWFLGAPEPLILRPARELTPIEEAHYRSLLGIANNLNQLVRLAYAEGLLELAGRAEFVLTMIKMWAERIVPSENAADEEVDESDIIRLGEEGVGVDFSHFKKGGYEADFIRLS